MGCFDLTTGVEPSRVTYLLTYLLTYGNIEAENLSFNFDG